MKRTWKIVGIATLVAILGLAAVGAVAFAQEPEDGADSPFKFRDRFREAIAGALGIDVEEYDAAVEEAQGKVLEGAVEEGVLTEEQVERLQERAEQGFGRGMMPHAAPGFGGRGGGRMPGHGRGGGMMPGPGGGYMGGPGNSLMVLAAEDLKMDVDELMTKLHDGETVAGLGGDAEAIAKAYLALVEERLEEAVANRRITEERAAPMLEQMEDAIQKWLTEPHPAEGECPGGHWRNAPGKAPGRFWGFPGQNDA